ncbi:CDP-alcohol phosphatidyltransferase family protein, partial [Bacteroidia bacterium]|nr:CDP-alcohol phosphatidyltransferase family protein [Bacteroidia bacterium]
MISYNYPKEKRNSDSTNLLRSLIFEKAGWYLALLANKIKIRPNTVTLISIIPGIYGIYCNSQSNFFMGILFMVIYYLLDNVDGHLARLSKKTSIYGSYLDDSIGIIL